MPATYEVPQNNDQISKTPQAQRCDQFFKGLLWIQSHFVDLHKVHFYYPATPPRRKRFSSSSTCLYLQFLLRRNRLCYLDAPSALLCCLSELSAGPGILVSCSAFLMPTMSQTQVSVIPPTYQAIKCPWYHRYLKPRHPWYYRHVKKQNVLDATDVSKRDASDTTDILKKQNMCSNSFTDDMMMRLWGGFGWA